MVSYAIVQASGKQFWIEEDRFYDFDKLPLNPGDNFKLNKVLLVNKEGSTQIGKPFLSDNCLIEATVVRHLSGSKIRVYKMRPKKKTRKKQRAVIEKKDFKPIFITQLKFDGLQNKKLFLVNNELIKINKRTFFLRNFDKFRRFKLFLDFLNSFPSFSNKSSRVFGTSFAGFILYISRRPFAGGPYACRGNKGYRHDSPGR